jgi:FtsP/CotA-like multicopper oxidase with cupredoxin domain
MVCIPVNDAISQITNVESGLFPGPLIEARSGDQIIVEVQNELLDEGVAIHWHGLWMIGKSVGYRL